MKEVKGFLSSWMQAVNSKDLKGLMGLYNETSILIPTFSNKMLNTRAKIWDYFERLASHDELNVSLHENTLKVQKISDNIYALSGIYLWKMAVEEELLSFEARFSFVLDISLASPVIHHHSSQIPRML